MSSRSGARRELRLRRRIVVTIFVAAASVLAWRAIDIQLHDREFLQDAGDARYLRVERIDANRGMILDRNAEPLAISAPIQSVWVSPDQFVLVRDQWPALAELLGTTVAHLEAQVLPRLDRKFVYLRRHLTPDESEAVHGLDLQGVGLIEENRRYYPAAEVAAHVVGFTNIDDQGQEGVELAFDQALRGAPGSRRVIKDRLGRVVEDVERLRATRPGRDVVLSIDKRIQYVAYRALKAAVQRHEARAGSMVILNPQTGEIVALVNRPSFNPNNRSDLKSEHYRNRAVTDLFEPGSTIKPFTIAAALESGRYSPESTIDTSPGYFKVGKDIIRDVRNYHQLDIVGIVEKSSNVGVSKLALSLGPELLWRVFRACGFGSLTEALLPGEVYGRLNEYRNWREIEHATLAFGYGMSVTATQLARAYMTIANGGWLQPLSIVRSDVTPQRRRAMQSTTAREIRKMLERAVTHGTGHAATVPGYSVAGKTGTVHKSTVSGYAEDRYLSLFAGMIPANRPRLVAIVVIDEPKSGGHLGGRVAAPVFANVMREATRILNIPPDQPAGEPMDEMKLTARFESARMAEHRP